MSIDMDERIYNIVVAGLGGQGVITASDLVAEAAFAAGFDVKKSEIHGMSQRGGSVASDVRFGPRVLSPMVPPGEADFLLVVDPTQIDNNRHVLKPQGILIPPALIDAKMLTSPRSINVALAGVLSTFLPINTQTWIETIRARLPQRLHEANLAAFELGRAAAVSIDAARAVVNP
jgi:indolepyruvate ferredoxin oxidoreductase beta subunit